MMSQRERYLKTIAFESVDRIPLVEWGVREATMNAWIEQGYPKGVSTVEYFHLDDATTGVPISTFLYPRFEERVLEQTEEYKIWIDNLGATRKDFLKDATPGFVTRSWLRFPVEGRSDFLAIKKRYDAQEPARYPEDWTIAAEKINQKDAVTHLVIPYLFWTVRDWMGFENLCMAFYDQQALVEEMFEFLTDFCIETLKRGMDKVRVDMVELKEDMAYKHAPMISPAMFRRFMAPHYRRLIDFLRSYGTRIVYVDCDGYPGGLIPEWIEVGVDGVSPTEIAAGNDPLQLRREYPGFAFWGGVDKRELAKGKADVYNEVMSKIPQMIDKGGFIPHVDHAIPPDVPLQNYTYFRELMEMVASGETPPRV